MDAVNIQSNRIVKYSTNEQIVGTYIDGKPLYQKTFVTSMPDTIVDGEHTSKSVDVGNLNVDKSFYLTGCFILYDSRSTVLNAAWYLNNKYYFTRSLMYQEGNKTILVLQSNRSVVQNTPVYVTFQYTKTTD